MNQLSISDDVLTVQLKNGDLHAGSILYTRHKQAVYSFCLRMLRDPASAQDAAQETFLKMISKIHSVQQGTTLKCWLFSVARNEVLMVLRRNKIVPMEPLEDETEIYDESTPLSLSIIGSGAAAFLSMHMIIEVLYPITAAVLSTKIFSLLKISFNTRS